MASVTWQLEVIVDFKLGLASAKPSAFLKWTAVWPSVLGDYVHPEAEHSLHLSSYVSFQVAAPT